MLTSHFSSTTVTLHRLCYYLAAAPTAADLLVRYTMLCILEPLIQLHRQP